MLSTQCFSSVDEGQCNAATYRSCGRSQKSNFSFCGRLQVPDRRKNKASAAAAVLGQGNLSHSFARLLRTAISHFSTSLRFFCQLLVLVFAFCLVDCFLFLLSIPCFDIRYLVVILLNGLVWGTFGLLLLQTAASSGVNMQNA